MDQLVAEGAPPRIAEEDLIQQFIDLIHQIRAEWQASDSRVLDWADLGMGTGAFEKMARSERASLDKLVDRFSLKIQSVLPLVSESLQRDLLRLGVLFDRATKPRVFWSEQAGAKERIQQTCLLLYAVACQWMGDGPAPAETIARLEATVETIAELKDAHGNDMKRLEELIVSAGARDDDVPGAGDPTAPTMDDLCSDPIISTDTFGRVRLAAEIKLKLKGAAARNRRYSPKEVDRLIAGALAGNFIERTAMAEKWAKWGSNKAASKPHASN